jgi:siroheme synthase-like protein
MVELSQPQVIVLLVSAVAALFNGGMGYGYSSITVPVALLFYSSRRLNPALVLVEVAANAVSLWVNRKALPRVWRRMVPALLGVIPGAVAGSLLLASVNAGLLKLCTFGALLPLLLLQSAGRSWPLRNERRWGAAAGLGVGVLYGATTISGPPLALLLNNQGLPKDEFRAALAIFRLAESTCTAIAYLMIGLYGADTLAIGGLLLPGVLVGIPLGFLLLRPLQAETFRRVCMTADALLVSFAFARTLVDTRRVAPASAYPLIAVVAVIEAWLLAQYFAKRSVAPRRAHVPLDYPIALRLREVSVLLIGGGKVAAQRLEGLLTVGAHVHVVAPRVERSIAAHAGEGRIRLSQRRFHPRDCDDARLVFIATNQPEVSLAAVAAARARGLLANAADRPELCDFALPSVGRRGPLTVAVSTSGNAPGLARVVREQLMARLGEEYGTLARLIGRLRRLLPAGSARARLFAALTTSEVAEQLATGDRRAVFERVRAVREAASE